MKKIISICLVLVCLLCVTGCKNSKKKQAEDAVELCVQYRQEAIDNPTNEKINTRSKEACSAAQTLLEEYFESDEFNEEEYKELEESINELYK